ncbi:acetate--CoA ligase family protein [Sphingomonas sp. MG17]|uniref:Acetate--CoA ligase family protein n=1 Tax=Sphingomonas tagetis TaxID=2949092 RepID=A0A9X2KL42_9SPHN|nr:acetate--CoA ligase family protein [Sphingomonas tagetis]
MGVQIESRSEVDPAPRGLARLVDPGSIAIIGASDRPGSLGRRTVENLLDHSDFGGDCFLISRSGAQIAGRAAYPSILDVPSAPDVAMLVVPATATLTTLRDCAARGVRYAMVFTSGFGEVSDDGRHIEAEMARIARDSGMRIYGPNSPGLCNQNRRIGMLFSPAWQTDQRTGPIGIVTHGGGVGRAFMQASDRGVGVGLYASTGNEVDITAADFIRHMADADDISVIAASLEGIKDGGELAAAALYAAECGKPVVALKVGRSEAGARAASSHTGSISGAAEVNSAAFREVGVVEVDTLDELIDTAALFARKRPTGREKIAVYSVSGSVCVMAADALADAGLELARFGDATRRQLSEQLPSYAAIDNPVDLTSDVMADPQLSYDSLKTVAADPDVGAVLYPFPCDWGGISGQIAEATVAAQRETDVPVLPIWLSDRLGEGWTTLVDGGMTPMRTIRQASQATKRWVERGRWAVPKDWQPLPTGPARRDPVPREALSEAEAKALLRAAGIAVPEGRVATSAQEAVAIADALGYPVVAKVASRAITHKSDIGGVAVNLTDPHGVAAAFARITAAAMRHAPHVPVDGVLIEQMKVVEHGTEVFVGVHRDAIFGPVMTFGLGGVFIELFKDVARRMLPLTPASARALLAEPRCAAILQGARGAPAADLEALERLLLAVSDFVCARGDEVEELELNPVLVGRAGAGLVALDAVLVKRSRDGEN